MAGILSYPISYRGLTLNGHYTTSGAYYKTNELNTYLVEQFDFSELQVRDQREGLHLDTGGLVGPATKQFRRISLRGAIRAADEAQLEDMVAKLFYAFDIEEAQNDTAVYRGVHALDFYCPTVPAVSGKTSPVHELFFARPVGHPRMWNRRSGGNTAAFALELACPDPRRYEYDITTVEFSTALGWTQDLPNWTDDMGAMTMAYVLIEMNGSAGASDFTITPTHAPLSPFTLDLSTITGSVAVDMQTMEIYRPSDGLSRAHLRTTDVDSWLRTLAGGVEWNITNTTNVSKVTALYRQARS